MVEMCRDRSGNALIQLYVCLNVLCAFVETGNEGQVDCGMEKWGITYMGTTNRTKSKKTCQAWASSTPNTVDAEIKDEYFPEGNKEEAQNFCRNPYPAKRYGVWCYTTDTSVPWEYCDPCPGNHEKYSGCTVLDEGKSYRGKQSHTQSHMQCEPWVKHNDSLLNFGDETAETAKDYCRNPDPEKHYGREAPWCFIKDMPGVSWDYCDICKPFQGQLKHTTGGYNKYSFQTSNMNRLACIRWCINWGSCVAAIIPHGQSGSKCWYLTSTAGDFKEDSDWDQYEVRRVCPARAQGKKGYFVEMPVYFSAKGKWLADGSIEECDTACFNNEWCANYDMYTSSSRCYYHWRMTDRWYSRSDAIARHLIHCDPGLKPSTDAPVIMENPEASTVNSALSSLSPEQPQPSEESLTDVTQPNARANAESVDITTPGPKEKGLPMVVIVFAAIAVIGIGGGGYYFYTRKSKKRKKGSRKGGSKNERKKLTSQRGSKRSKGKNKHNKRKRGN